MWIRVKKKELYLKVPTLGVIYITNDVIFFTGGSSCDVWDKLEPVPKCQGLSWQGKSGK